MVTVASFAVSVSALRLSMSAAISSFTAAITGASRSAFKAARRRAKRFRVAQAYASKSLCKLQPSHTWVPSNNCPSKGVGGIGAVALKSGHAVQRKRCGSLNRSFSYWEAARSRRPFREASPGTSQATGGSLQVHIGGVPVPSRIQLFQRNGVAKMEWVPRRPPGRAVSSKILGMKVKP